MYRPVHRQAIQFRDPIRKIHTHKKKKKKNKDRILYVGNYM